jgi:hypothetical protein
MSRGKRGWFKHHAEHVIAGKGGKVYDRKRQSSREWYPTFTIDKTGTRHRLAPPKYYEFGGVLKGQGFLGQEVLDRKHITKTQDELDIRQVLYNPKTQEATIFSTIYDSEGGETATKKVHIDELKRHPELQNPDNDQAGGWKVLKEHKTKESAQAYHNLLLGYSPAPSPKNIHQEWTEPETESFIKRVSGPKYTKPVIGKQGGLLNLTPLTPGPPSDSAAQLNLAHDVGIQNPNDFSKKDLGRFIHLALPKYRTPENSADFDKVLKHYGVKVKIRTQEELNKLQSKRYTNVTEPPVQKVKKGDIIPEKITYGYPGIDPEDLKPKRIVSPSTKTVPKGNYTIRELARKKGSIKKKPVEEKKSVKEEKKHHTIEEMRVIAKQREEERRQEHNKAMQQRGW